MEYFSSHRPSTLWSRTVPIQIKDKNSTYVKTYSIINTTSLIIDSTFFLITKNWYNLLQLLKFFFSFLLKDQQTKHKQTAVYHKSEKIFISCHREKSPHHQDFCQGVAARPTYSRLSLFPVEMLSAQVQEPIRKQVVCYISVQQKIKIYITMTTGVNWAD